MMMKGVKLSYLIGFILHDLTMGGNARLLLQENRFLIEIIFQSATLLLIATHFFVIIEE